MCSSAVSELLFSEAPGSCVSVDVDLRNLVADRAAGYFANIRVPPSEIPKVINQIAGGLRAAGAARAEPSHDLSERPKLSQAQIRKSITQDKLISFEDNKPYKTLGRH